ncbi:hypothetical protein ABIC33_006484 [Variovorax sp. 1140]|uniref:hypothetical protein n=1 Tax=Variovorax atrisoli TaxID=3394203 RepID=UPI0033996EA4
MDALDPSQVQQFARQVENIVIYDSGFRPLKQRFIEFPAKRPGVKIGFGVEGPRMDFVIAAIAFLGAAMLWAQDPVSQQPALKSAP